VSDEKRYDGTEILGQVSGLGRSEVQKIWGEVKANSARLDACVGPHDFQRAEERLGARFTCTKCGGTADASAVHWYQGGLVHGRAHPEAP
jgi:hypothetical protein